MSEYIKTVVPTAISLIAAIFSILTYLRNRRFENENYIYRNKYESYAKILGEMNKLINGLQDYIFEFKKYLIQRDQPGISNNELDQLDDEIDNLADKVDDLIFNFDHIVVSNSLVIPQEVLGRLEYFSEKLLESELPESVDKDYKTLLNELDKHISELIQEANGISDILRDDLSINELNMSLYRRIKQ